MVGRGSTVRGVGGSKNKSTSRSNKAGLRFPVCRPVRFLKAGKYAEQVGAGAPVKLMTVLEYNRCREDMAMVTGSEISRPDGSSPNQLRSLACSRGLLHRAHGSARWSQEKTIVLAGVYGLKASSGKNENPEKAILEVSRKPKTGISGRRTAVGGAGGSKKKSNSRSRAWLGMRNSAEAAARAPPAAAKRVPEKIKWKVLGNRIVDLQNQERTLSHFKSKEVTGQVFDEMPHRDLISKRGLFSIHAQNGCAEEVLGNRHKTQCYDDDWPMLGPAELRVVCFRGASSPCKLNSVVKITCCTAQKITEQAQFGPLAGCACTSFLLH